MILRNERGETLLEILVTMLIMGVGLVAIVSALGSLIIGSDTHRSLAQGEVVLRDYGEAIKTTAIESTASPTADPCPDADDLDPTTGTDVVDPSVAGEGWRARITHVWYWVPDPSNFPNGTWSAVDNDSGCEAHYTNCGAPIAACTAGLTRVQFEVWNSRTDYARTVVTGHVQVRRNDTA